MIILEMIRAINKATDNNRYLKAKLRDQEHYSREQRLALEQLQKRMDDVLSQKFSNMYAILINDRKPLCSKALADAVLKQLVSIFNSDTYINENYFEAFMRPILDSAEVFSQKDYLLLLSSSMAPKTLAEALSHPKLSEHKAAVAADILFHLAGEISVDALSAIVSIVPIQEIAATMGREDYSDFYTRLATNPHFSQNDGEDLIRDPLINDGHLSPIGEEGSSAEGLAEH